MTRAEIIEKLQEIMKSTTQIPVDWDAVDEATSIASIGIDSLAMLDLIYDLQQGFEIDFEPEELVHVVTVGDLATFLHERLES